MLSQLMHVDNSYEVHISHELSDDDIKLLEEGVDIGDKNEDGSKKLTLPSKISFKEGSERDENGNPVILLTIHEGRFHQVKRMLEAVGNEVLFLKRLSMGSLLLDPELNPGEYRELTAEEKRALNIK